MKHDPEWLTVGRFGRPHGIKGFITVISFTEPVDNILNYLPWHVKINKQHQPLKIVETSTNNKNILVKIEGYSEREQVALLTNSEIMVKSDQLEDLKPGEYYWRDLIGMQVITQEGNMLGTVDEVMATGSNDVLIVTGDEQRHLIPWLPDDVIIKVDRDTQVITVNWDPDF